MSSMDVRALARRLEARGLPLHPKIRGVIAGKTNEVIKESAQRTNLSFENRFGYARMLLASELLGRDIESFKQLNDGEMKAISAWVRNDLNEEVLDEWMVKTFGKQLTMRYE